MLGYPEKEPVVDAGIELVVERALVMEVVWASTCSEDEVVDVRFHQSSQVPFEDPLYDGHVGYTG